MRKIGAIFFALILLTLCSCGTPQTQDTNEPATSTESSGSAQSEAESSGDVGLDSSSDSQYDEDLPSEDDEEDERFAHIEVEGYGVIIVELDRKEAPITVENFVNLAKAGFYDGLTFHRIINGFIMQGGEAKGDKADGIEPIRGEFEKNGVENEISHVRGVISMARRGDDYDSATSQFFIVQSDSVGFDGKYAAFGYVIEGMDVVDRICSDASPVDYLGLIEEEEQPVIKSITIKKTK